MAKNQLAVGGKKQFSDVATIVSQPAMRAKLQTMIDEVIVCKTKVLDLNETIKATREAAVEELAIDPKMFNALVSLYFNNNFEEKRLELQNLDNAIESLMQTGE